MANAVRMIAHTFIVAREGGSALIDTTDLRRLRSKSLYIYISLQELPNLNETQKTPYLQIMSLYLIP